MSVPYRIEETSAGWLVKTGQSVIAIRECESSATEHRRPDERKDQ